MGCVESSSYTGDPSLIKATYNTEADCNKNCNNCTESGKCPCCECTGVTGAGGLVWSCHSVCSECTEMQCISAGNRLSPPSVLNQTTSISCVCPDGTILVVDESGVNCVAMPHNCNNGVCEMVLSGGGEFNSLQDCQTYCSYAPVYHMLLHDATS